jgi:undecaprenyl-diphosphatase
MLFLQNLRTPFLSKIVELLTSLGEMAIVLAVLVIIYWCVDKKKGFLVAAPILFSTVTMQALKAIFRVPRPFMRYPDQIIGERQHTATGYSFPSGHSTTASSFYGGLFKAFREKWIRAIAISLMIIIPLTRLYLGVHWPMDVIVGTAIGLFFSLAMGAAFLRIYECDSLFFKVCKIVAILTLPVAFVLAIALDWTNIDYRAVHNLMQNSAIAGGMFLGAYLERKNVNFKVPSAMMAKIKALLIGLLMAAPIALVPMVIPFMHYMFEFATYAFLGAWISFIYPMIAVKKGWMDKESK